MGDAGTAAFNRSASPAVLSGPEGFSLIEVIITLIIAALFTTVFVQYMGSSLRKSAEPVVSVQRSLGLLQIMESMTADYKRLMVESSDPLAAFKSRVENGNDPNQTPYYGAYSAATGYILFSDGMETPDTTGADRILKVTVTSNEASLTALFTR